MASDNKMLNREYYETEYKSPDWTKETHDYRNYVLDFLTIMNTIYNYSSIVDIGCGDGKAIIKLAGKDRVGIDFSLKLLKTAKQKDNMVHYILADAQHLPFKEHIFDLTICMDVIEHIQDHKGLMRELQRISQGNIILTTDYTGPFAKPYGRRQIIDTPPKLNFLKRYGKLMFFNKKGKPAHTRYWARGVMLNC